MGKRDYLLNGAILFRMHDGYKLKWSGRPKRNTFL